MSENNMAVIQFLGYRLVNIHYNCAPEFEFPEGMLHTTLILVNPICCFLQMIFRRIWKLMFFIHRMATLLMLHIN